MLDRFSALSKDLAVEMDAAHAKGGNPGYPARQMLRLHVLRFLLNERYANHFLNRVDNDPQLRELCGHGPRSLGTLPSADFKNDKLAPYQDEFWMPSSPPHSIEDITDEIEEGRESKALSADAPAFGEILAIDATDIPAYARPRGEHCDPPGEGELQEEAQDSLRQP